MATFVTADLHFGDEATCSRYCRPDGSPLRPFANAAEMDAEIIRRWNETVGADDTVYVLGDVGRGRAADQVRHLRGEKHLVAGNGDDMARIVQAGLFASVRVWKQLPRLLLTHVPVHPTQLRAGARNIHGHLHARAIDDPRYVCVSLEQTDFRPVPIDRV
jgi:calcineurin-like phosphoesterase family protein